MLMQVLGRPCDWQFHTGRSYAALTARMASQDLPSDAHTLQHRSGYIDLEKGRVLQVLTRLCDWQFHTGRSYAALTARIPSQSLLSDAHAHG